MRLESFPKRIRLRKRAEFLAVQGRGRKVQGDHLLLLFLSEGRGTPRVGVTVSSKVGCAVTRNRLRRWVREHVRRHQDLLPPADVVIILRSSAATVDHATLDRDLTRALARATSLGHRR